MDKAGLLGEVINQVKILRQSAAEATRGTLVPTDIDEVTVEEVEEEEEDGSDTTSAVSIRASLCCDFKHELLCDLREALNALQLEPHHLKAVRADISTLGTRMINVFLISGPKTTHQPPAAAGELQGQGQAEGGGGQAFVESIRQAFRAVLDKFYASEEFSARNTSSKRRRVSFFASSSTSTLSSGAGLW